MGDATFLNVTTVDKHFVDWEEHPEEQKEATALLSTHLELSVRPEFQLKPLPDTNPVLDGQRWKNMYHILGQPFSGMPSASWDIVTEEKATDMRHLLEFPYNGEAPPDKLIETNDTPSRYHFVRNHGAIPRVELENFILDVDGLVNRPAKLTLDLLQNPNVFPQVSVFATLQCAGNRREDLTKVYPGEGDELINAPWSHGAISTTKWTGVSLKKIIKHCGGLKDGAKHLELFGADTYIKDSIPRNYVVSVPWSKVRSNEVLICWAMDGKPIPRLHGFPLRAVVLGYIGARSCKWLFRIRALETPSQAPVQSMEYLYFNSQVGKHNGSASQGISIQEMPVSSAILAPRELDIIEHDGTVQVRGWAYSGGGRWPERVEVSPDGGFNWYAVPPAQMSKKHRHAWRLWSIDLPLHAEGWGEIRCRCWDNAMNTQPSNLREIRNWDSHVVNSQHNIKIYSVNRQHQATVEGLERMRLAGSSMHPITKPMKFEKSVESEHNLDDPRDPEE